MIDEKKKKLDILETFSCNVEFKRLITNVFLEINLDELVEYFLKYYYNSSTQLKKSSIENILLSIDDLNEYKKKLLYYLDINDSLTNKLFEDISFKNMISIFEAFSLFFRFNFLKSDYIKFYFLRTFSINLDKTIWKLTFRINKIKNKYTNLFVPYILYCIPHMCKLFNLKLEKMYLPPFITINEFCLLNFDSELIYNLFIQQANIHASKKLLTFDQTSVSTILKSTKFRLIIKKLFKTEIKLLDSLLQLVLSFLN